MKAPKISYVKAKTLNEALQALADHEDARVLAGGQSLLPMLNLRLVRPELLIDISQLSEISFIRDAEDHWIIGSGVTHAELEDASSTFASCPLITEVAGGIAYRSVRNLGTIGGAVAHADPAADWPLALAVLGGRLMLRNSRQEVRTRPVAGFLKAPFTSDLQQDELIEWIEIPKPSTACRHGYFKFCRKAGDFAEASAAVMLDPARGHACAYLGALDGPPVALLGLARELNNAGVRQVPFDAVESAIKRALPNLENAQICMYAAAMQRAIERAALQ